MQQTQKQASIVTHELKLNYVNWLRVDTSFKAIYKMLPYAFVGRDRKKDKEQKITW